MTSLMTSLMTSQCPDPLSVWTTYFPQVGDHDTIVLKYELIRTRTAGEEAFWKCGQTSWHPDRQTLKNSWAPTRGAHSLHLGRSTDRAADAAHTLGRSIYSADTQTDTTFHQPKWQYPAVSWELILMVAKAERSRTNSHKSQLAGMMLITKWHC